MVSTSNPCQETDAGNILNQVGTRTYKILFAHPWVDSGHYSHALSAEEPTNLTIWMAFLHFLASPTNHPILWKGLHALLTVQSAWKDDQDLVGPYEWLSLINMIGCWLELWWLFQPMLYDVSSVLITSGGIEKCIHAFTDCGNWYIWWLFSILKVASYVPLELLNVIISGLVCKTIEWMMFAHGKVGYLHETLYKPHLWMLT